MRIEIITPPAGPPVALEEVKDHLRIDHVHEDAYLTGLIQASVSAVEAHINRFLAERIVAVWLNDWGWAKRGPWWDGWRDGSLTDMFSARRTLALPVSPVSELLSVSLLDRANTATPLAIDGLYLQPGDKPTLSRLSGSWPSVLRPIEGIRIELRTGYGDNWNPVPPAIRQAILLHIGYLYTKRGDEPASALSASGASALLAPYKRARL